MIKRLLAGMAFACPPAAGEIILDQAMITGGGLRVSGRLSRLRQATVTLDGVHETRADANGHFAFRVVYHPATCVVSLKAEDDQRQAIVGFCG